MLKESGGPLEVSHSLFQERRMRFDRALIEERFASDYAADAFPYSLRYSSVTILSLRSRW